MSFLPRNNVGSFAMLTAIRASSSVKTFVCIALAGFARL
jgi:hypothetical protein